MSKHIKMKQTIKTHILNVREPLIQFIFQGPMQVLINHFYSISLSLVLIFCFWAFEHAIPTHPVVRLLVYQFFMPLIRYY